MNKISKKTFFMLVLLVKPNIEVIGDKNNIFQGTGIGEGVWNDDNLSWYTLPLGFPLGISRKCALASRLPDYPGGTLVVKLWYSCGTLVGKSLNECLLKIEETVVVCNVLVALVHVFRVHFCLTLA